MTDKQPEALRLAALLEKTGAKGSLRDEAAASLRARRVALVLDVENLIELVGYGGVAGTAGGDVPGCVALAGVAVSGKSGSGCGRTRKVCGRGSHPEPTGPDTVEHADSASVKALAIRQKSDLRTGVSELGG